MGRFLGLLLCTYLLFMSWPGFAAGVADLPQGVRDYSRSEANLNVSRVSPQLTSISLQSPVVTTQELVVDYKSYQVFGIAGEPSIPQEGSPTLPHVSRLYQIPNTGGVDLVITNAEFDVVDNIDALPLQFQETGFRTLARNEAVYSRDGWYPAEIATMSEPMIMRDFRVVSVSLCPVQINPVTHQARIYRNLSVDVVANSQPGVNELLNPHRPTASWAPIYRSAIANLDDSALDDMTTTPGTYLIICKPDAQSVNPFVDSLFTWKTRQGHKVIVDSRTNWDVNMMTTAIRNYYSNQDPPVEFVCLVGAPFASFGVPAASGDYDHAFALGNTGDDLEDMGVGRLCGSTAAEMATINAKLMSYERNPRVESAPGVADTMWFHKAYLLAGTAMGCASNYLLMQWGASNFQRYTDVDSVLVETVTGTPGATQVNPKFTAGIGFFLWRGAWISEVNVGLASGCNSGWRLPLCLAITCTAGDYTGSNGMAASFLTAGTAANPKGGVCGIGSTTSSTHNPENITFTGGLLYNIINMNVEHIGTAMSGGKALLYNTFGTWSNFANMFSRFNNLFGDPGMSIWTSAPEPMDVMHPTALNVGARSVDVTVNRAADGVPVADAMVCLWKRGAADSTWVRGTTDENGHITLPVSINMAGNLFVTVTKQNHKPYLATVPCSTVDCMPMLSSYTLDDDNSGGSHGNGDHVVNPGETIDIPVYIRNFGTATQATGISATLTSDNPRVTVVTGTSTYPNIAVGDSALGATTFRVQVNPTLQNRENALLSLAITSSAGQATGAIRLIGAAGELRYQRQQFTNGTFDPGTTRSLSVTVKNTGAIGYTGITGQLQSLSPFVTVTTPVAVFGDIAPGARDSNYTNPFEMTSNSLTFRGHQAPMLLILTSSTGEIDSTQFIVNVGTAATTDPTGPDAYGYYAYDNTDLSYEMHPTFNYVNISAGLGTNLNLADTGDKSAISQIWSTTRVLPFPFRFYGQVYDTLTICSNGWCAFGNQGWFDNFRNYRIPAMQAPEAMIAPYWDDLVTSGTGLGVWVYSQPDSGRYIIQWKATGRSSGTLDFEVILLDSAHNPTMDGNNKILVQYNDVTMNLSHPDYDEMAGCTIGIQAPRSLVGLSYAYVQDYSPGAATVVDGRAILFTTDARMLFGQIEGSVINVANNQPIPGASVDIHGTSYHAVADNQGHYLIDNVLVGTYVVHASMRRFNTDSVANIVVELDSTATANFSLTHPEMALSVDTLRDSIGGTPEQSTFRINNAGNGPLDFGIEVRYAGDDNPTPWDSVGNVAVTDLTGNYQAWGCEFLGDTWWVTAGGSGGQSVFYRFDREGALVGTIPQPATTMSGWMDLATDGTLLYGSDSHVIYGVDMTGQVVDSIPSPLNPTRAIAYDPTTQHFWIADYTSDIYEITRSGVVVNQVANTSGLTITGLAWNAVDANGFKLYIFSQDGSSQRRLTRMRPTAPFTQETVVDLPGTVGDRAGGCAITGGWNSVLLTFAGILRGASGADHLEIYEMTFNTTWISVVPSQGSVPASGGSDIAVHFDPVTLRDGIYHVNLRIASAVYDTTMILPVELEVARGVVTAQTPETALPTQYALRQNYPNPFNPTTQIAFDLPKAGHVELQIYNSLGQLVATLLDDARPAGMYTLAWDAHNVSAGIYFYRLKAGSFVETKKMLLIR